jgi:hypothetical protein
MANEIQQPRRYDLVGNPILVGGVGSGFEATLQYRIHDGHDERTGHFTVGGGTGEHGQFQLSVDVSGASFQLDRLFVEIYEESAAGHLRPAHRDRLLRLSHTCGAARRHAFAHRKRQLRQCQPLSRHRASKPAGHQQSRPDFSRPAAANPDRHLTRRLSFDHVVGAGEQRRWNLDAEHPGGLQVDPQFVLGRCLHRKVGGPFALEDAMDV